jgi:hypothetical protein
MFEKRSSTALNQRHPLVPQPALPAHPHKQHVLESPATEETVLLFQGFRVLGFLDCGEASVRD